MCIRLYHSGRVIWSGQYGYSVEASWNPKSSGFSISLLECHAVVYYLTHGVLPKTQIMWQIKAKLQTNINTGVSNWA